MKKLKLSQAEIDKLVVVERRVVEPTVFKVGVVDVCFQISVGRKPIWQYKMWKNMLMRCFCNKYTPPIEMSHAVKSGCLLLHLSNGLINRLATVD